MKIKFLKGSLNKKALLLITVLAIVSGFALIVLFYTVETVHIRERAALALKDSLYYKESENGKLMPDTNFVHTDELSDDSVLLDFERELLEYYTENKEDMMDGEMYRLDVGKYRIYFMPMVASKIDMDYYSAGGRAIIYADVSFESDLIGKSVAIMAAVMFAITVFLCWLERKIVWVLDQKDERMKVFFANASHELKTPLMAISGYADGMEKGIVDIQKGCSVITKETERMSGMIGSILEVSKIDSGMVTPRIERNDVREILYDAICAIELAAEQKNIAVIVELPKPILYPCDEDMLFSVFSNILTNCIRYAEHDIRVFANLKKEKAGLKVCISNDGKLISEKDAAHLFERFYKGAGGQTGLGMALSMEYMQLLHGNIAVRTESGRTIFEITM